MAAVAAAFIIGGLAITAVALGSSNTTSSVNVGDQTINELISSSNSATQNCAVAGSQIQSQNVTCSGNSTCNVDNDWNQTTNMNSACLQQTSTQNNINAAMSQSAEQIAQSQTAAYALASAEAKNYYQSTANLATIISNTFTQNCTGFNSQYQIQNVVATDNATVNAYNDWSQYNNSMVDCVSDNTAVNNVSTDISQDLDQQAKSKVVSFLGMILSIIIVIIVITVIFVLLFFLIRIIKKNKQEKQEQEEQQEPDEEEQEEEELLLATKV